MSGGSIVAQVLQNGASDWSQLPRGRGWGDVFKVSVRGTNQLFITLLRTGSPVREIPVSTVTWGAIRILMNTPLEK